MKKKIIKVNYGLASSYDDFIEINVKIKGKLRKKMLDHEKRHENDGYSLKDFNNDFNSKNPYFFESILFSLRNPESIINFFPFMYSYYGKFWSFNLSSIYPFFYFGLIFILFFYLLFKISIFQLVIGYISIVFIINIILLLYTHIYVTILGN